MLPIRSAAQLRTVVLAMRAAHARDSAEWTRRMESPADRHPRRPL